MTHTYVEMTVTRECYDEVLGLLRAAGYDHAIGDDGALDMHGIALVAHDPEPLRWPTATVNPTD